MFDSETKESLLNTRKIPLDAITFIYSDQDDNIYSLTLQEIIDNNEGNVKREDHLEGIFIDQRSLLEITQHFDLT